MVLRAFIAGITRQDGSCLAIKFLLSRVTKGLRRIVDKRWIDFQE